MSKIGQLSATFVVLTTSMKAYSCPFCYTDLGQQVRAGIFNADFGRNFAFTVLPFVIFIGIIAAVQLERPRQRRS